MLVPTGWRKLFGDYYDILFSPEGTKLDTSQLGKGITSRLSELTVKHSVVFMGEQQREMPHRRPRAGQGRGQVPVAQHDLGQLPDHGHRIVPRMPGLFSALRRPPCPVKKEDLDASRRKATSRSTISFRRAIWSWARKPRRRPAPCPRKAASRSPATRCARGSIPTREPGTSCCSGIAPREDAR